MACSLTAQPYDTHSRTANRAVGAIRLCLLATRLWVLYSCVCRTAVGVIRLSRETTCHTALCLPDRSGSRTGREGGVSFPECASRPESRGESRGERE